MESFEDLFKGLGTEKPEKDKAIEWMKEKYPGLFPVWPKKK